MMVKNFGLYLLQKRYHAVWVVLICAFLPIVKVPTFSIGAIILGLVTLHKGAKEGFLLLCWLMLPGIAVGFYDHFGTFWAEGVAKGITVWLMACILTRTTSWVMTLQLIAFYGVLLIVGFHLLVPDISAWWLQQLTPYSAQIQTSLNLNASQVKLMLDTVSSFATGILVFTMLVLDTALLFIARAWQAVLFNPGGLGREWRRLHIGHLYSGILLAILVLAWFDVGWLLDIFLVVLIPFVFAGLSLVHAKLPDKKSIRIPVLVSLYVSLLFFSLYIGAFLVVLAFLDSWFDFRDLRKAGFKS